MKRSNVYKLESTPTSAFVYVEWIYKKTDRYENEAVQKESIRFASMSNISSRQTGTKSAFFSNRLVKKSCWVLDGRAIMYLKFIRTYITVLYIRSYIEIQQMFNSFFFYGFFELHRFMPLSSIYCKNAPLPRLLDMIEPLLIVNSDFIYRNTDTRSALFIRVYHDMRPM